MTTITPAMQATLIRRARRRRRAGKVLPVVLDAATLRPIGVSTWYRERGPLWSLGYHTGNDHPAPVGSLAVASTRGTIVHAGPSSPWGSAYGTMVIVRTAGGRFDSGYAHLSATRVLVGDVVVPGQIIGLTGATGHVTGAHLHHEVRTAGGRLGSDRRPIRVKQLRTRKARQ